MAKDRFKEADRSNQIYSDMLTNLNRHPVSGDIVRYVNEQAVIRSIKNLLMTDKKERWYYPDIGSNIRKLLFEPMGSAIAIELSRMVRDTINEYEPRAKVLQVQAIADPDRNRYVLTIVIMLVNKSDPITFNVALDRVR